MSPESCGYFLAMSAVYSQRVIPMIICDSFWPHGICSKMLSIQCYFKFFRKCVIRRVHERFSDESRGRQFASVHELNNAVIRATRSSLMKSFLKEMWDCSSKRLNIGLIPDTESLLTITVNRLWGGGGWGCTQYWQKLWTPWTKQTYWCFFLKITPNLHQPQMHYNSYVQQPAALLAICSN